MFHQFALKRHPLAFVMLCALIFFTANSINSQAWGNNKYASIIIDGDTGFVLGQRNADKVLHPASLTKMMTMMMAFEALEARKISLNDRIRISHHAASMQPSKLALPVGSSIRVDDALKALAVKSANDIAVAMAEFLGGSESKFARQMTRRAHAIGMTKTRFMNASGLHDPRQVSTARDMARLSRYLIYRHAQYYSYFSLESFTYRGTTHRSHNRLMKTYPGMDGLKTGYINASGFNLAASSKRDGRRIISVVFGGRSSKSRNAHMQVLLDRGFKAIKKTPDFNRSRPNASMLFSKAPLPLKKPISADTLLAQNISQISPAAGAAIGASLISQTQDRIMGALASSLQDHRQNKMPRRINHPPINDESAIRFQTGLIAIAAHSRKQYSIDGIGQFGGKSASAAHTNTGANAKLFKTNFSNAEQPRASQNWSVQLGAFKSRSQTDRVLRAAYEKLPNNLRYGQSMIMPARINNIILFRGRLTGYTENHANAICGIVNDCLVIRND